MTAGNDQVTFSPQEAELAQHLRRGATNQEIAQSLNLGTSDVAARIVRLLQKLRAKNRQDLLARIGKLTVLRNAERSKRR